MAATTVRPNTLRPRSSAQQAKERLQGLRDAELQSRSRARTPARAQTKRKTAAIGSPSERVLPVAILLSALYVGLAGRLFVLQVVRHKELTQQASKLRQRTIELPAQRGVLLDRDGSVLVRNEPACDIEIDPNDWFVNNNPKLPTDSPQARQARTVANLSVLLPGVDVPQIVAEKGLVKGKTGRYRIIPIAQLVSTEVGEAIRKNKELAGVAVRDTTRRKAVSGDLAPHVLGFTGKEGKGLDGLENGLDEALTGATGTLAAEFDRRGHPIPGTVRKETPAQQGRDVILTLDSALQHDVQESLASACEKFHAEAGTVVVLEPKSGDILSLANYPTYNVNHRNAVPASAWLNRAVTSPFEPGSTLKMVTVAAALEEKRVTMDSRFDCAGKKQIGKRTIHCALHHPFEHGHGSESLLDVIKNSCNVATADCAFGLGREKLYEYDRAFGLGEKTGAGLPGESRGTIRPWNTWSDMQLANVGFGQGISVTPLQLAAAYGVIANDGVYQRPRIVWGARDDAAGKLKPTKCEPGRRVVSPGTARAMREMLQAVVDSGTGTKAQLSGYTAGGKTGTAQIAEHGSYQNRKFVASFVGMAPMHNPRLVILVSITDPKGPLYYGGQVSAPVFKEIAEKALMARRVPHDKTWVAAAKSAKKSGGAAAVTSND